MVGSNTVGPPDRGSRQPPMRHHEAHERARLRRAVRAGGAWTAYSRCRCLPSVEDLPMEAQQVPQHSGPRRSVGRRASQHVVSCPLIQRAER